MTKKRMTREEDGDNANDDDAVDRGSGTRRDDGDDAVDRDGETRRRRRGTAARSKDVMKTTIQTKTTKNKQRIRDRGRSDEYHDESAKESAKGVGALEGGEV